MTGRLSTTIATAAALWTLAACGGQGAGRAGQERPDILVLTPGSMSISIKESAELKAAKETFIKSEIEGQSTILFLVDEGAVVEQGQKLVELDVSEIRERRATQKIAVERARADMINAQQNMEILDKEIEADKAKADSELEIAEIDVEKFLGRQRRPTLDLHGDDVVEVVGPAVGGRVDASATARLGHEEDGHDSNGDMLESLRLVVRKKVDQYGDLPAKLLGVLGEENFERDMGELGQQVLEQIDRISLQTQELAIAKDTFEHSKSLAKKDYITRNELDKDRLRFESQQSVVALAWQKLNLLISYQLRKAKIELTLTHSNAELEVDKTTASANARRAREQADLSSREAEYELATGQLENLERQIENSVILAPTPGLVVYAEMDRHGGDMIQEGTQVRERQALLVLPDVTMMTAEVKIQESDIDTVRVGQRATIQVDAFPDQVFTGHVTRLSPVADSGSRWSNNDLKVYKCRVSVDYDNAEGRLRPHMAARVEILVGTVQNKLAIPMTAVGRQGGIQYAWLDTESGPVATPVKIGRNTLAMVEIVEGLSEGDRVFVARPPGAVTPRFEEPEIEAAEDIEPPPPEDPDAARARREQAARLEKMSSRDLMAELRNKLVEMKPELAEVLEAGRPGALFSGEVRAFVESEPELSAIQAVLMQKMMERGRNGGGMGGSRREGGGGPGAGGRRNG